MRVGIRTRKAHNQPTLTCNGGSPNMFPDARERDFTIRATVASSLKLGSGP
jgi:hypothetical protein